jgi:hypothetical protein
MLPQGNEHVGNSRLYVQRKQVRDNARAKFDEHIAELEVDMEQAREHLLVRPPYRVLLSSFLARSVAAHPFAPRHSPCGHETRPSRDSGSLESLGCGRVRRAQEATGLQPAL